MKLRKLLALGASIAAGLTAGAAEPALPANLPATVLGMTVTDIKGAPVALSQYAGKVVMIVNVASKCGHTPQYKALEKLYETYKDKGFVILGFPADNFGHQEPGTNAEILTFCTTKYQVTFDMFAKVSVKGDDICPLYAFLTSKTTNPTWGGPIKWNFTKLLLDRKGQVINRFEPGVEPDAKPVIAAIEAELAKS